MKFFPRCYSFLSASKLLLYSVGDLLVWQVTKTVRISVIVGKSKKEELVFEGNVLTQAG